MSGIDPFFGGDLDKPAKLSPELQKLIPVINTTTPLGRTAMQDNVTQSDVTEADKAAVTAFHNKQAARILAGDKTLGDNRDCIEQAFAAHRLASTAQPEVKALVEALEAIKAQTSAEDDAGENYRWDDREGALDFAYATAAQALTAYHEAQP